MQLGYVSRTKTAKNKDIFFLFHAFMCASPQQNSCRVCCRLKLRVSLQALENLWQTQDQSPLLLSKAHSLELRLTQLRNIIAFKAHLNLFITIIHSPELSKSSHQSHFSAKKKQNSTDIIHENEG